MGVSKRRRLDTLRDGGLAGTDTGPGTGTGKLKREDCEVPDRI